MADRNTRIRGVQIFDNTIPPSKMKSLNSAVDDYILEFDNATQDFRWIPKMGGVTETPSGLVNGSNKVFTLSSTPENDTLHLYLNGLYQEEGVTKDYVISGTSITFVDAPAVGDIIIATYITDGTVGGGGNASSYKTTFVDGDLTTDKITINHALDIEHPVVMVYDNNEEYILPSEITYTDSNNVELDFTNLTPLSGTYKVRVIG